MKGKKTKTIKPSEAKDLVNVLGPQNFAYDPVFPNTRKDVCAITRMTDNGPDYRSDTIYLVWKNEDGLNHKKIASSEAIKCYVRIYEVLENGGDIVVRYGSDDSHRGSALEDKFRISKKELGLK
ncbi:MAG: hypothetical protein V1802_03530 [Candidatus Aenigmatarchaeota archaeon]